MRNNRGITLVALIVTVIIMLILLSVSAVYVFDKEDGIVQDAQDATEQVQNQINDQEKWTQNIIDEF